MCDLSEAENKAAAIPDDPYEKGDKGQYVAEYGDQAQQYKGTEIQNYKNVKIQNCKNTEMKNAIQHVIKENIAHNISMKKAAKVNMCHKMETRDL